VTRPHNACGVAVLCVKNTPTTVVYSVVKEIVVATMENKGAIVKTPDVYRAVGIVTACGTAMALGMLVGSIAVISWAAYDVSKRFR
jgi:hypothetical protein